MEPQSARRRPRKRALLIGINYTGQPAELSGCVNDVADVRAACAALRYDEVCVLCDGAWPGAFDAADARLGDTKPSRANMTAAFRWLVDGAGPGDRLYLHYSGHGGQLRALVPGSEADGLDETLVPVDYATAGMVRDDELRERLVVPLYGSGAALRATLDCCHSGTGMDLRHNLQAARGAAPGAPPGDPQSVVAQLTADAVRAELARWFGEAAVAKHLGGAGFVEWSGDGPPASEGRAVGAAPPDILVVSGCADSQTSADAWFGRRANGALTHCLLEALAPALARGAAGRSWPLARDLLRDLRRRLSAGGYDQVPQVSSEAPVGAATRFDLA